MYHRVAVVQHDPWQLAVTPDRFEEQIAYIRRHRTPMSMDQLVERLRSNTLPANAVAITFDDGYRDNLLHARPVLAHYEVPATVFLATGFMNQSAPFWWDELATMILGSTHPVHKQNVCAGENITLDWSEPEPLDITANWRGLDEPQTARQRAYLDVWRMLRRLSVEQRDQALHTLRHHLGITHDLLERPMTSDEIRDLLSDGLIQLGAHTVTHPSLPLLSREESRREIGDSVSLCRALARTPVHGFAYPYGDFNSDVRNDIVSLGLTWACSTQSSCLDTNHSDIYALPRIAVPNAPIDTFVGLMTA